MKKEHMMKNSKTSFSQAEKKLFAHPIMHEAHNAERMFEGEMGNLAVKINKKYE